MSGFCGWIGSLPTACDGTAIARMADALPPYGDQLSKSAEDAGGGLASRARIGGGDWFADDRCWVALEGYPRWSDPALKAHAEAQGHAATLKKAFLEHDRELFDRLHGPVSFAIIDRQSRRALIAIDRAGITSLCYAEAAGALVFGSTTDSVRAHPAIGATIHPQSIYDFFYFVDKIPAPGTIYQEQKKLIPGEFLSFANGRTEVGRYWQMPYKDGVDGEPDALKRELLAQLRGAVGTVVAESGPARLGAFLSGGLDSSTVVALLSEGLDSPLETFTIAFEDARFDESSYAGLIAERFGTEHESFLLGPEQVEEVVAKIVTAYDEPFGNTSAIPAFVCAERAKQKGIEVMVAGDGGDEYFAGNARYLEDRVFDPYQQLPRFLRKLLVEPALSAVPFGDRITLLRRARKYVQLASMSEGERLLRNNIFLHQDYREIFTPDVVRLIDPSAPLQFVDALFEEPSSRDKLHRLFYVDQRLTLADCDLRKVGVMCDLADVRVRYPFLDENVMEFSARIPSRLLMKGGRLRAFYKEALAGVLPRETLTKPKHGFGLPYASLMKSRKRLRAIAQDSLEELKQHQLFQRGYLDGHIERLAATSGPGPDTIVWDLMALSQWLQSRRGFSLP